MTRKTSIVEQIGSYFAAKGKVMTADEYKNEKDTPIRFQLVKRGIGSWSRLLNMVGDISQYPPVIITKEVFVQEPVVEAVPTVEVEPVVAAETVAKVKGA
jgi:hypothetical protein